MRHQVKIVRGRNARIGLYSLSREDMNVSLKAKIGLGHKRMQ